MAARAAFTAVVGIGVAPGGEQETGREKDQGQVRKSHRLVPRLGTSLLEPYERSSRAHISQIGDMGNLQ
jgi:hypothetical protein